MAQLEETSSRHKTSKRKTHAIRVDLTPMVDLGFLLITFFILTTAMKKPMETNLLMPKDTTVKTEVPESKTLTVKLEADHRIDYYEGEASKAITHHTTYAGIRRVIQDKQRAVGAQCGDPTKTILIIAPSRDCTYEDFMRLIDEIQINGITTYFVADPMAAGR